VTIFLAFAADDHFFLILLQINDDFGNRIATGTLIIKPDVQRITETGVVFTDGSFVEADVILLATG